MYSIGTSFAELSSNWYLSAIHPFSFLSLSLLLLIIGTELSSSLSAFSLFFFLVVISCVPFFISIYDQLSPSLTPFWYWAVFPVFLPIGALLSSSFFLLVLSCLLLSSHWCLAVFFFLPIGPCCHFFNYFNCIYILHCIQSPLYYMDSALSYSSWISCSCLMHSCSFIMH